MDDKERQALLAVLNACVDQSEASLRDVVAEMKTKAALLLFAALAECHTPELFSQLVLSEKMFGQIMIMAARCALARAITTVKATEETDE